MSLAYDGERSDAPVLDQLETILRHVADELALWRARAVKAEAELKEGGGRGPAPKLDPETRGRVADLEQENRTLRQRVDAARARVQDLLSRLTFLEEQARESAGSGAGRGGGGGGGSGTGAGGTSGAVGGGGGAR
jgi:hypothetical protein